MGGVTNDANVASVAAQNNLIVAAWLEAEKCIYHIYFAHPNPACNFKYILPSINSISNDYSNTIIALAMYTVYSNSIHVLTFKKWTVLAGHCLTSEAG